LFLSKRSELIYNSYLWKDSLAMMDVAVTPATNQDHANGMVQLPQQIDRVVALRNDCQGIRVHGLEDFYRMDFNEFCQTGMTQSEFAILDPIWLTVQPIYPALSQVPVVANYVGSPSPSFDMLAYLTNYFGSLTNGDIYILTAGPNDLGFDPGDLPLQPGEQEVFQIGNSYFPTIIMYGRQAGPWTGTLVRMPVGTIGTIKDYTSFPPEPTVYNISSDNAADNGVNIKVVWRNKTERYVQTLPLPVQLGPDDNTGFVQIEALFKPVTKGNVFVTVTNLMGTSVTPSYVPGTLAPAVTRSPQFVRVRLFAKPTQAFTLRVLGKKPFVPLDFATEKPLIRNLDNCLIAFATADLLQRARQFGKAAQQMQEGAALLAELARLEVLQAANNARFIPDGGYGDPFFAPSSNRGLWM
jgi:hypothetical protein